MKPLIALIVLLASMLDTQAAPPPNCRDLCLQEGHTWSYCTSQCNRTAQGRRPSVPPGAPYDPAPAYPGMAPRGPLVQPGVPTNPLLKQPGLPRNPAFDAVERSAQPAQPLTPPPRTDR